MCKYIVLHDINESAVSSGARERKGKMSSGKQLIRGKSGMRMIAASENERSPFLLEEPCWTDDAQVFVLTRLFVCVDPSTLLFWMGIVSNETMVLRRWEVDKQKLGLSTEAWII